MVKVKLTTNKKKESAKSFKRKAGELRLIRNRLHVIPAKGNVPTGQTSTPKTTARYSMEDIAAMRNMAAKLTEYHNTGVELLWRYKALKDINRRLLLFLKREGWTTSGNPTDGLTYTPSSLVVRKAGTTSETGAQKTSNKNLDSERFSDSLGLDVDTS